VIRIEFEENEESQEAAEALSVKRRKAPKESFLNAKEIELEPEDPATHELEFRTFGAELET